MENKPIWKNRLSWEEYAINMAEVVATRSEDPWIKVGAVVLRHNNTIASCGYNGLPSGAYLLSDEWADRNYRRKFIVHAESNCLNYIKRGEGRLIAVTLSPCVDCIKLIASKDIKKIIYKEEYTTDPNCLDDIKILCKKFDIELKKYD
ncbi:MAG: deoxycytidylate deaminase [Nanoarchaeota archaeon]